MPAEPSYPMPSSAAAGGGAAPDDVAPASQGNGFLSAILPEGLARYFNGFAWSVFLPAVALTIMGITAISSAKPGYGRKQWIWLLVALGGFLAASLPHYRRLARLAYVGFGLCIVLLLVVMKTPARGGAHRWIDIGPGSLQPSELTKLAFIIVMAEYLRFRENYREFTGLVVPFLLALVPMGLILVEPDLGTSLLFLPTLFAMLYAAGARRKHLIGIVLMGVLAMPLFWTVMRDYQRMRVAVLCRQLPDGLRSGMRHAFKLPEDHILFGAGGSDYRFRTQEGHHLHASLDLIRRGDWLGDEDDPAQAGMAKLPENHTDFVFAVWAWDTGFLGNLALLATFVALIYAGLRVGMTTPDPFGRLLAVGVISMLAVQALVNIGMTVGLMPITGITLPFMSYGGSSLLSSYIALGLLVNVSRRRPFLLSRPSFEFDEG